MDLDCDALSYFVAMHAMLLAAILAQWIAVNGHAGELSQPESAKNLISYSILI